MLRIPVVTLACLAAVGIGGCGSTGVAPGGGGGGGGGTTPQTTCSVPATSNPPGGGGTAAQIQISPSAYGTGNAAGWTAVAFSEDGTDDPPNSEILSLAPDMVPRAVGKWDTYGILASQYNDTYAPAAEAEGIKMIGGTTATVLFADEPNFSQVVSCDASGNPAPNPIDPGSYRGALAAPAYQQYLISIGELQIDAGYNGIFYDEVNSSYQGANFDSDAGFDDADIADFGGFLCAKYPSLTAAQWSTQYGVTSADKLNCTLPAATRGRGFLYRQYLARNGWTTNPLTSVNPLAVEWGEIQPYSWQTSTASFVQTYPTLVYWQNVVTALRAYARQKYGKEIFITSNGPYPFVDFQTIGLWDGNQDAPDQSPVEWIPTTPSGAYDGAVSWQPALQGILKRAQSNGSQNVPVVLFIDWPDSVMSAYYSLSLTDRQNYMRMLVAESYANGLYFALPVNTSIGGDPTATQLGMMPLFQQLTNWLKAHAALYHGATQTTGTVNIATQHVMTNLVTLPDGSTVLHLVNHNYSGAFLPQTSVAVSFPVAQPPSTITLVSPDASADTKIAFTWSNGELQVTVPQLIAYTSIVAK
ncbi:MAG TPA: hypothetical protein VHX60_06810 [Acidobacteriaceae bacterium]|jgi:hypothetical protein|nr:hypothetical protein [Acidobacteriaceae bacterium]